MLHQLTRLYYANVSSLPMLPLCHLLHSENCVGAWVLVGQVFVCFQWKIRGLSHEYVAKRHHYVNFQNIRNPRCALCRE